MTSQKDPYTFIYSCTRPLGGNRYTGAHGEPDSGDGAHRRRGERGGGARGGHGLPWGGLGATRGDRRRAVHGSSARRRSATAFWPAARRVDGGAGRRGKKRGWAEWGRSTAQRSGTCARLAASNSLPAAAWLGNRRGNSRNAMERGEHELRGLT